MRTIFLVTTVLIASSFYLQAQDGNKKTGTLRERFQALSKQYQDELEPLLNPKVRPKTNEEIRKSSEDLKKLSNNYSEKFLELAKSEPKDSFTFDVTLQAYTIGSIDLKTKATEFWLEHCADDPRVIDTLPWVYVENIPDFADRLAKKTKSRAIKGMALFASASEIIETLERRPSKFDPPNKKQLPAAEHMEKVDAATKRLQEILKEYGTEMIPTRGGKSIAIIEATKPTMHLAEHLALGRLAPDFEAESVTDGSKHKLADDRGKIVILDFYTYNGGYTHDRDQVLPSLKRTAKKFQGKPVQILSVSYDEKKDSVKGLFKKETPPWLQLWIGEKRLNELYQLPGGTASTQYILDAKGVIRAKHKLGNDLDAILVTLLKESGISVEGIEVEVKADVKKLNGEYTVIEALFEGKPHDYFSDVQKFIIIKDGTLEVADKKGRHEKMGDFTVDSAKKPALFDLQDRGDEIPGIYELQETNAGLELTIVINKSGRPKDFKGDGKGTIILKLLRKKEK